MEQVSLFEEDTESVPEWVHELKGLNLMSMTPMDAMNIFINGNKWKRVSSVWEQIKELSTLLTNQIAAGEVIDVLLLW